MPQQSTAAGPGSRLRLLGRWQLVADGQEIALGHREERLAALLGLTGRRSRLHIAGILWPESTDERALASLRRAVLQTQKRCPGLLQADRLTIGLGADVEVDVTDVRRAAAAADDGLVEGEAESLLARLVGAQLLPDWYDDWVLHEREALEQLRAKALERIARRALEAGDLALTLDAAQAASEIDPLVESARELAIRAHLARGDQGSARREFERYCDAVRVELDAPPSQTIVDLIEPAAQPAPAQPAPAQPAPAQPAPVAAPVRTTVRIPVPAPTPVPVPAAPVQVPVADHEPLRTPGVRGPVVRLLGIAALILAVALALAGLGHDPRRDDASDGGGIGGTGGTTLSDLRVLPAEAVRAGQIVVRPIDTAVGRVAFLVRATLRPAAVRIEVRGSAGVGVVRDLMVRSAQGRVLRLEGLDPGVYRWLASSAADTVSGRLRIPDQAVPAGGDTTLQATGPSTTTVAQPTASTSSPPSSGQQTHHRSPPGHTPAARPKGRPTDPGVEPVTPVG